MHFPDVVSMDRSMDERSELPSIEYIEASTRRLFKAVIGCYWLLQAKQANIHVAPLSVNSLRSYVRYARFLGRLRLPPARSQLTPTHSSRITANNTQKKNYIELPAIKFTYSSLFLSSKYHLFAECLRLYRQTPFLLLIPMRLALYTEKNTFPHAVGLI